jgi:hypothetical protein
MGQSPSAGPPEEKKSRIEKKGCKFSPICYIFVFSFLNKLSAVQFLYIMCLLEISNTLAESIASPLFEQNMEFACKFGKHQVAECMKLA